MRSCVTCWTERSWFGTRRPRPRVITLLLYGEFNYHPLGYGHWYVLLRSLCKSMTDTTNNNVLSDKGVFYIGVHLYFLLRTSSHLCKLELRPILPAVTSLALRNYLPCGSPFPQCHPNIVRTPLRPMARLRARRSRAPAAGLAREV